MIIPSIKVLQAIFGMPVNVDDDVGIHTMRPKMLNDLSARYADMELNKHYVLSTSWISSTKWLCSARNHMMI